MFRELLAIFRPGSPLNTMGEHFFQMLKLTSEMTNKAGDIYFHKPPAGARERSQIYDTDVAVNRLQRTIRKEVVAHLSVRSNTPNLPYCILLVSLVKDVERIGDYAKNLSEVIDLYPGELPKDEIVAELQEMRSQTEEAFQAAAEIFARSDRERALSLINRGQHLARRADALLGRIAKLDYDAGIITALVLGTRYYKRISGHVLNILSSVVMPLHKVDYYDEDEIPARKENA